MNKQYYDMPLQSRDRKKIESPEVGPAYEQYITPIMHNMKEVHTQDTSGNYKYDLPCQSQHNQIYCTKTEQNRPAIMKNAYRQSNHIYLTSRTEELESHRYFNHTKSHQQQQTLRTRVTSIYEKLLEESKFANKINSQQKDNILTQATFKPKQLQKQLARHNSAQFKKYSQVRQTSSKKQNKKNIKNTNSVKKLDFAQNTKTKYQQILQQHFRFKNQPKKNNQKQMNRDQIRLSKICGKDSAILKLKQRLEPMNIGFSSKRNEKTIIQNSKQQYPKQVSKTKGQNFPEKNGSRQLSKKQQQRQNFEKRGQSQRWMSLSFHERQQKVISNRKQKETQGKKYKLQKQTQSCTFKPQMVAKSKSQRILNIERQSYLSQYYDRLHRKY